MIDTPNTFWKPAANTRSHRLGRTSAETRRPVWCTNFTTSRLETATRPRSAWVNVIGFGPSWPAAAVALVESERVQDVPRVEEALDGRPLYHPVPAGQEERLAELPVPGPEALARALEAVEGRLVPDEVGRDRLHLGALGPDRRLHDRLHRHPGGPVVAGHRTPDQLGEAVVELGRPLALPRPVPPVRDQAGRARHRPRLLRLVRHIPRELAVRVGDHHHVVVTPGREERDVVLGALARVFPEHEGPRVHDLDAEALGGPLERGIEGRVARRGPLQHERLAPLL